jgi:predicted transcriptional regulator
MAQDLKSRRTELRLSQSQLARLSGVKRTRICLHELGDHALKVDEVNQIEAALRREAARLRGVAEQIECAPVVSAARL